MDFSIEEYLYYQGCILSELCVIILVITWCFIPKWRTLLNYISLNQIIIGTIHLHCILTINFLLNNDREISEGFQQITGYLFMINICWSLSYILIAYIRLVLLYTGQMSCEKRQVTVFTYLTVILIKGITIILSVLHPEGGNYVYMLIWIFVVIMTLILIVFVRIVVSVMACCQRRMSNRKINHILSLIGIAIVSDIALIGQILFLLMSPDSLLWNVADFIFTHRLVFQTLLVLFKTSSREHWLNYIKKRRNRYINNIRLN